MVLILQVGTHVGLSASSNFISKATTNCSVSLDMNIIEIDSSGSEDDIDIEWPESPDRSCNTGTTTQWRNDSQRFTDQNHGSEMNFQNYPNSNNHEKVSRSESSIRSRPWTEASDVNQGNNTTSSGRGETSHMSLGGASHAPQLNGHDEVTC